MKAALSIAVAAMALAGCAQVYQYQQAPGERTAVLKLGVDKIGYVSLNEHEGCPKKRMDLNRAETVIPANKRLWVEPSQLTSGALGESSCVASMSFVAQADKEYFVVFETAANACNGRILTRDDAGKLALEPSFKREQFKRCML